MGTYIVTGASSGIGWDMALQLAQEKHRVLALARSSTKLEALAAAQPGIRPVVVDLSDLEDMARLQALFADERIDGLINNAAVQNNVRFLDDAYSSDDMCDEITLNFLAPLNLMKMVARLEGPPFVVVNVNSGLGFFPKSTSAVYSATKAALLMMGRALELQPNPRFRVVDVILPLVDTPMTAGRGRAKISPALAARAIIGAMEGQERIVYVGKAKLLRILMLFAPWLAARILRRM